MKVAFSLMIHNSDDDRVAYQEAAALQRAGDEVSVFSAYEQKEKSREEKSKWLLQQLVEYQPEVIVCDTPIAVKIAYKAKKKIGKQVRVLYDITEWYPSKKNLRNVPGLKKIVRAILLTFASLLAGFLADGFIFGEYYKSLPFKVLFFWKSSVMVSYYASKEVVKQIEPKATLQEECVLYYSGNLTKEKGYNRVVSVAQRVATLRPEVSFKLRIVSANKSDEMVLPDNLKIDSTGCMSFPQFCETVGEGDIYMDLRDNDVENSHCLPIKLFYYMMAGRPMIYSNLKAIQRGVPEFDAIGCMSDPDDEEKITAFILKCVDNPNFYRQLCQNSLNLSSQRYNWENIENQFVKFIHNGI